MPKAPSVSPIRRRPCRCARRDVFDWLQGNGWIYSRPGVAGYLGYQRKTAASLLEHKITTVLRTDGSEKVTEQIRVTAKGLTKLAVLIRPRLR